MIVAQGGGVLLGMAASVNPISAVRVVLVSMTTNVGGISAVRVRLSLGIEGGVGVLRMGVASISKVVLGVGVSVTTNTAGPQETKNNRIRLAGNNRKILGKVLFMALCLLVTEVWLFICDKYIKLGILQPTQECLWEMADILSIIDTFHTAKLVYSFKW